MKYFIFFILLAILLPAYCSIPFKNVLVVTIEVTSKEGNKIREGLKAVFYDKNGDKISEIFATDPESFDNILVWWVNNQYPERSKNISPSYAATAVKAVISATGCADKKISINIISEYQSLSFSPHGGGVAYMYYHLDPKVKMDCSGY